MKIRHFGFQLTCVVFFCRCEMNQQHLPEPVERSIIQIHEDFKTLDSYLYADMTPFDIRCLNKEVNAVRPIVIKRFGGSYSMMVARDVVNNPKGRALYKVETVLPTDGGTISFSQIIDGGGSPDMNHNWQEITSFLKTNTVQSLENEEFKRYLGSEHYGIIEYRLGGEYFKRVVSFGLPAHKTIQDLETMFKRMCPDFERLARFFDSLDSDSLVPPANLLPIQ